jgi:hypothetical protein
MIGALPVANPRGAPAMSVRVSAGLPFPLGASWDGSGVNVAVFSANATRIELCLFDVDGRRETDRIALPEFTHEVWHGYFPDLRPGQLNSQRENLPSAGCDIYRIHLGSRAIQRLTFQEFTPNTGAGNWHSNNPVNPPSQYNRLGYGILNLGPCPVPGGKIAFTSNRNGYTPPRSYTAPCLQLFVMDDDGENVTPIATMTIGSALHPTPLRDGRVMFAIPCCPASYLKFICAITVRVRKMGRSLSHFPVPHSRKRARKNLHAKPSVGMALSFKAT